MPEIKDDTFLYGEEYVKEAYHTDAEKLVEFEKQKQILEATGKIKELKAYLSVDERIVLKLQEEGKLFKKETYEHSYPHCWRTDKPVLYYPLDSWFIKSTAAKDRMIELNKTINWKPEATGTGRFGNWLENLNDWNLSRSRFWGIPIPIWTSEDSSEQIVIGSAEELKNQIDNSIAKGFMTENPLGKFVPGNFTAENYDTFDLHKPYADNIVLEKNGKKLFREPDLIDVWFDSGAMPYAQVHYPFENKELIDDKKYYPADFIAEGVDQTRGWFFTLHAIATMNFDSVAYKNVVSNGLVLDKNGNKMSKRLGNAVDPFETIEKYGADATRWYMIANAAPWDNLKFDVEGIGEVQRKLFGTLYNTYGFFALYANVDNFVVDLNNTVNVSNRSELDRWILSKLNSLVKDVTEQYETFEPHKAARYIEEFVDEHLSNWYIRLSRRRFWKGDMSDDKKAAYETLFECLNTLSQLHCVYVRLKKQQSIRTGGRDHEGHIVQRGNDQGTRESQPNGKCDGEEGRGCILELPERPSLTRCRRRWKREGGEARSRDIVVGIEGEGRQDERGSRHDYHGPIGHRSLDPLGTRRSLQPLRSHRPCHPLDSDGSFGARWSIGRTCGTRCSSRPSVACRTRGARCPCCARIGRRSCWTCGTRSTRRTRGARCPCCARIGRRSCWTCGTRSTCGPRVEGKSWHALHTLHALGSSGTMGSSHSLGPCHPLQALRALRSRGSVGRALEPLDALRAWRSLEPLQSHLADNALDSFHSLRPRESFVSDRSSRAQRSCGSRGGGRSWESNRSRGSRGAYRSRGSNRARKSTVRESRPRQGSRANLNLACIRFKPQLTRCECGVCGCPLRGRAPPKLELNVGHFIFVFGF